MFSPQKVILPGIIGGCAILVLIARLLTSTQIAIAATPPASTPQPGAQGSFAGDCTLSLSDAISGWCGLIEQAAQKYNVSPQLIAAVMLQESGGQADVVSASGAVGQLPVQQWSLFCQPPFHPAAYGPRFQRRLRRAYAFQSASEIWQRTRSPQSLRAL
jgi:hypothetical protein